ncbi:MAG: hypothetical protein KJ025_23650, partial [Burkholderiales bacterium]|nr:hypothetical protein [Burkholderiales bacterium]
RDVWRGEAAAEAEVSGALRARRPPIRGIYKGASPPCSLGDEAYAREGKVAMSGAVKRLLKPR